MGVITLEIGFLLICGLGGLGGLILVGLGGGTTLLLCASLLSSSKPFSTTATLPTARPLPITAFGLPFLNAFARLPAPPNASLPASFNCSLCNPYPLNILPPPFFFAFSFVTCSFHYLLMSFAYS